MDFARKKEEHTSIDFDYALKQVPRSFNRQLIKPARPGVELIFFSINEAAKETSASVNYSE